MNKYGVFEGKALYPVGGCLSLKCNSVSGCHSQKCSYMYVGSLHSSGSLLVVEV